MILEVLSGMKTASESAAAFGVSAGRYYALETQALMGMLGALEPQPRLWLHGGAIGSESVEGACKHLIQPRLKRAGMRWKSRGFLNVLKLRLARLNGTDEEFWKDRGLHRKAEAGPTG